MIFKIEIDFKAKSAQHKAYALYSLIKSFRRLEEDIQKSYSTKTIDIKINEIPLEKIISINQLK